MQRQTMASMLAPVTAKIKADAKEAADIRASTSEPTFHAIQRALMNVDPENNAHKAAIALGKKRSADHLENALNPHHLQHKASFETFKSKYQMDPKKMEDDYVAAACDELNAFEYEKEDPNYVSTLKLKYKPHNNPTITKMKIYENFCNALDEKHKRVGYKNDKKFVESYTNDYCLEKNDNDMNLREFEAKP